MRGFWSDIASRLAGRPKKEPKTPRPETESPLIVGLDFGTSGTKVVVRDPMRRGDKPIAIDFGTPEELGFNRFVIPSTVAVVDEVLHFGAEAEYKAASTQHVFRSLKRDFLRVSRPGLDPVRHSGDATLEAMDDEGLASEFLVTVYLADVLRRTWRVLAERREDFAQTRAVINLDVPIASLNRRGAGPTFLRMLRVARRLSTTMEPGATAADLGQRWIQARRRLPAPAPESERLEDLVPEAVAAIGGLGEAASYARQGTNWVVVDVGAGTTDIGFFRYPDRDGRRAVFYSARTTVLGGDDVDWAICQLLGIDKPTVEQLGKVRLAKTRAGTDGVPLFDGRNLTQDHVESAVGSIREAAMNAWGLAFGEAYSKDIGEDRWRRLDTFVVGGGSLTAGIKKIYECPPRSVVRTVAIRQVNRDVVLESAGAGRTPPSEAELIFLLAALGLSLPPTERPEMVHPEDVPPAPSPPKGPTGVYDFDADDMFSG